MGNDFSDEQITSIYKQVQQYPEGTHGLLADEAREYQESALRTQGEDRNYHVRLLQSILDELKMLAEDE